MGERSGCPINLATEALGDRWTMVLLRDIMFGDRRTFRGLLNNSLEGIATNILASRLKKLVAEGFLTAASDPDHKQRTIYSLTEKAIALLPAMIALGAWGRRYLPTTPEYAIRNQVLEEGGARLQEAFMDELRERHLGIPNCRRGPTATEKMQAAFEQTCSVQSKKEGQKETLMPQFLTIGYGDREGYDQTPREIRDAAHAQDQRLLDEGAVIGVVKAPVQVRNPNASGVQRSEGAYLTSALPVAGFALIEAADLEEAIQKVSIVPCAVAHGVVEIWPIE